MNNLEKKLLAYLATGNSGVESVQLDFSARKALIIARQNVSFIGAVFVTRECPIKLLSEDPEKARLEMFQIQQHSESLCYDFGITDNYLFAMNSKFIVVFKDGYICCKLQK